MLCSEVPRLQWAAELFNHLRFSIKPSESVKIGAGYILLSDSPFRVACPKQILQDAVGA